MIDLNEQSNTGKNEIYLWSILDLVTVFDYMELSLFVFVEWEILM